MNLKFAETRALAERIEGMLSVYSMAVMDSVLSFQSNARVFGDIVEMGVYRGRSATVLNAQLSEDETLWLYDVEGDGAGLPGRFKKASTTDLRKRNFKKRSVKFCHIDTSHMFSATVHELSLAEHMLADYGIVALDDFTNLDFSQMMAAMFKYLYTTRTDLKLCLVTLEKAYLCRRSALPFYEEFFLNGLQHAMAERGFSTVLARTEIAPEHRPFNLRAPIKPDEPSRYGAALYGHLFTPEPLPGIGTRMLHFLARNIRRNKYRDAL